MEPTPSTHPDKFEPFRGASRNKESEEIWERDKLHKNHWEVYRSKKDWENGARDRAVWDDGRLKQKF